MNPTEVRYCPKCRERKECSTFVYMGATNYSLQSLDFAYFLCNRCKAVHVDPKLLRKVIQTWKSGKTYLPSVQYMHEEVMNALKKTFCKGYTFIKFPKNLPNEK